MTIITSKGTTHEVRWIDVAAHDAGTLALQLDDARRLPDVAADFDGLAEVQRYDEQQGDKTFTGFTQLAEIRRLPDGSARLILRRE